MAHSHHHDHHHHDHEVTNVNQAFIIGIALNLLFVIIEFGVGIKFSALSLLSDAGHNLADVSALFISLLAFKLMKVSGKNNYTYGYKKTSILASLLNAIILLFTVGSIIWQGIERLQHPQIVEGKIISLVAIIGIVINATSALLFFKNKEKDINIKGAYLHLMTDVLVSFGVVIAGVIIYFTHFFWVDTLVSFVLAIIIIISTWQLLIDSIRLALDGVPPGIDMEKVKQTILKNPFVTDVHHIHIWGLSSNQTALTAHVVTANNDLQQFEKAKHDIKHSLEHLNIHHATIEVELENCNENCAK